MSTKELKEEINRVLQDVPDDVLESVLDYLKGLLTKVKSGHYFQMILIGYYKKMKSY